MKRILHTILMMLVAGVTFAQSYPRKCTEEDIPSSERKKYFEQVENNMQNYYMLLLDLTDQEMREDFISQIFMDNSNKHIPEFYLSEKKNQRLSPGQYLIELDKVTSVFDRDELEFQIDNFHHQPDMYMINMRSCYTISEYDLTLTNNGKVVFKRRCRITSLFPKASSYIRVKTMQIEPVREIISYQPQGKKVVKIVKTPVVNTNPTGTSIDVEGVNTGKTDLGSKYLDEGLTDFQNKYFIKKKIQEAAEAAEEDEEAQYQLGTWYKNGIYVEKNLAEAVKWFNKAASNGHIKAKTSLAKCYYYGEGVKKSYKKAYELFESVTNTYMGFNYKEKQLVPDKEAVYYLAWMQEHGQGCDKYLLQSVLNYQKCGNYKDAPDRIMKLLHKEDFLKYLVVQKYKKGNQLCKGTVYAIEKNRQKDILIGAAILVVGSDNGCVSDIDGKFNLEGLKPGDVICAFFIGYENFYYEWKEGDDKKQHEFILRTKINQ